MPKMTLSSPLLDLLPDDERAAARARRSVSLAAGSWPLAVDEIRSRFPRLADRVLADTGTVVEGFLLVVNDELVDGDEPRAKSLELEPDDEIYLIAQMAGG
jgi:molybdopterin converting factor small subunit